MSGMPPSSPGSTVQPTLFSDYSPAGEAFDELLDGSGAVREHWRPFVAAWDAMGTDELGRLAGEAGRLLRDNGITYTAHDDPAAARPWSVDVFPLVISPTQWREISQGIAQRARLLDVIIRDVYAEGRLLIDHGLPPELIFANPGFLRPCRGLRVPDDTYLHLYAADLVRMTDGCWRVVAEQTDAPLGLGYALENRLVLARLFPQLFHECRVERLAPFFLAMQQGLRNLAPQHQDNPRIVMLSEGPKSFHYFEDAYLARYLNFTLVEAGDLTVRDNGVWLKTLGGLLPVDVIVRRLSDQRCDPLELRGDTSQGVAGLLQAVRAGRVAVVNALGSSLAETPALQSLLPALCRTLLDEELQLPSVESWWSGSAEVRQGIVGMAENLVIGPAFPSNVASPTAPVSAEPEEVAALLRDNPFSLVAHAPFLRSVTPTWDQGGVHAAPISLRVFAVRTADGYQLLPGGLARVVKDMRILDPALAIGETSKDAWIIAEEEVPDVSLLQPQGQVVRLRRGSAELPSRVADNMFWLGRYVERADVSVRVMRALVRRLVQESDANDAPELAPLFHTLVAEGQLRIAAPIEELQHRSDQLAAVLAGSLLDPGQSDGFQSILKTLDQIVNHVRDRLSLDSWKILDRLMQDFRQNSEPRRVAPGDLLAMLERAVVDLAAFSGIAAESMTRAQSWRFMEFGRRIERAMHMVTLVKSFLGSGRWDSTPMLETVLQVADSLMTYRSRYLANLRLAPVLDLLLTDETNPRSLAFQLVAIEDHVANLPRDRDQALLGPDQRLAMNMLNSIRQVDAETLEDLHHDGERSALDNLLLKLQTQLPRLSDLVSHKYFVHAGTPRQLAERRSEARP
jgi:uncharacterized circularly permuted ATP-grasp superfamily protein/uncharacterized alpha-E superfamily protein